jgi:hypothetical protein
MKVFKNPVLKLIENGVTSKIWTRLSDWFQRDWFAILIFLLGTLLAIYPLLPEIHQKIIGWPGDNVQYVYMTGWFAKALASFQSPFIDPHLNYPDQLILAATDMPYAGFLLVSPLAWLINPTLAYNFWIFISYLFSGYFTYLWIQRLTGNRFAGIISGMVFLLLPFRVVHTYGHLQLVSTQFIPIFFWSLDHALVNPIPKRILFLIGATFLLSSGASQYYLMICLFSGLFYALFLRLDLKFLFREGWKFVLAVGIGAVIGSLPYLTSASVALYEPYAIEETRAWSASIMDYLVPSRLHPIWGELVERYYPRRTWIEHTLYNGIFASGLALIGVLLTDPKNKQRTLVWLGTAIIGWIISLGTDLHLYLGNPLQETNPIWLPAYYLGKLPFFEHMRTWARFAIIPLFFISLLAGMGIDSLDRKKYIKSPVKALILILILVDLMPGRIEAITLKYRTIDEWIDNNNSEKAVAFLPAGVDNYAAMYGSLLHEKQIPAYNHPTHLPDAFLKFAEIADRIPSKESFIELGDQGYQYLIFDPKYYDGDFYPTWDQIETEIIGYPNIEFIAEIDRFIIAEIRTGTQK